MNRSIFFSKSTEISVEQTQSATERFSSSKCKLHRRALSNHEIFIIVFCVGKSDKTIHLQRSSVWQIFVLRVDACVNSVSLPENIIYSRISLLGSVENRFIELISVL